MKQAQRIAVMVLVSSGAAAAALPPVPIPPENPITEPKRVLGKMLFFEEQLSADRTVACATCHWMTKGGADPRPNGGSHHPGVDGIFNNADDAIGSPGVSRSDALGNYLRDLKFGTQAQVTNRAANTPINAVYNSSLFWDGRAQSQFVDPDTGLIVVFANGALETQAIALIVNSVEMGHDGITWSGVTSRLRGARPMALAKDLPTDVAAALVGAPGYPELFRRAFGDTRINAARIGLAIATYERTLVSGDTPWDRFIAGQTGAMTANQQAGWNFFRTSACNQCHISPLFHDGTFRNDGVRPPAEDRGQQLVTGSIGDRGKFKTPTLRNVGLKPTFMHNGMMTSLTQVVQFYAQTPGVGAPPQFADNRDPLLPVAVPTATIPALVDFLANGLTDARVRDGVFPFDQPTLYGQRPEDQPTLVGGGLPGSGGIKPRIIATAPPMIGNTDFKIGLDAANGGRIARLALSKVALIDGIITPEWILGSAVTSGTVGEVGVGVATHRWPLTGPGAVAGETMFAQWIIDDPGAAGGQSYSTVASISFFCAETPTGACPPVCLADLTGDGQTTTQDIFDFLGAYFAGSIRADVNNSGVLSVQDVFDFLTAYFVGCG